jgi:hypothetical protein
MKTNYTQQEVLLMTGTTFLSGHLCGNTDSAEQKQLTEKERLEEACWNGLLQSVLPEICSPAADGGILYLWQVREGSSFLELELCEVPAVLDKYLSIDPYFFLEIQSFN